jgi:hypothetical protein
MFMGQPQMQYAAQGYNGGMGGGAGMMPGMAVPNGGYMAMGQGMLPPGVPQGQGMYAMPQQQAQWNMNQVTRTRTHARAHAHTHTHLYCTQTHTSILHTDTKIKYAFSRANEYSCISGVRFKTQG